MLSKTTLYHKNTRKVHRVAITIFLLSLYCLETTQPSRCSKTKKKKKIQDYAECSSGDLFREVRSCATRPSGSSQFGSEGEVYTLVITKVSS